MFNFIIFPYRDLYFSKKFGYSVRDLQIIKTLKEDSRVKKITIINRPVSFYERIYRKRYNSLIKDLKFFDVTSFDLIGPFKGRKWTETCYSKYLGIIKNRYLDGDDSLLKNVVLDFLPIAKIDYELFDNCYIWYDLIDNFTKHNRFDAAEKILTSEKYEYVNSYADLVTGVSELAIKEFTVKKKVVSNGICGNPKILEGNSRYTFGFIGFVTDKFNIEFVELLANSGYKIGIYGKSYDKNVTNRLKRHNNIDVYGGFNKSDLPNIMQTFDIGLLPYISEKSHDGSPLKLYEYLNYGKPTVSTEIYEIKNEFIFVYKPGHMSDLFDFIENCILEQKGGRSIYREKVMSSIKNEYLLSKKVSETLDEIASNFGK